MSWIHPYLFDALRRHPAKRGRLLLYQYKNVVLVRIPSFEGMTRKRFNKIIVYINYAIGLGSVVDIPLNLMKNRLAGR